MENQTTNRPHAVLAAIFLLCLASALAADSQTRWASYTNDVRHVPNLPNDIGWSDSAAARFEPDMDPAVASMSSAKNLTYWLPFSRILSGYRDYRFEIPACARIDGIGLTILKETGTPNSVKDYAVYVVPQTHPSYLHGHISYAESHGGNRANPNFWGTRPVTGTPYPRVTYGGENDKWGRTDWSETMIEDSFFGGVMSAQLIGSTFTFARVDAGSMTVYYTNFTSLNQGILPVPVRTNSTPLVACGTQWPNGITDINYRWTINGNPQSTGWDEPVIYNTLNRSVPSGGHGLDFIIGTTISCSIRARCGEEWTEWVQSDTITVIGEVPTLANNPVIVPPNPYRETQINSSVVNYVDTDGTPSAISMYYIWYVDGVVRQNSTGTGSRFFTCNSLPASQCNRGSTVQVVAQAYDSRDGWSLPRSSNIVTIIGRLPEKPTKLNITPEVGPTTQTFQSSQASSFEPDGDNPTYRYIWYINGTILDQNSTSRDYVCPSRPLCKNNVTLVVRAYATDPDGSSPLSDPSDPAWVLNSPPACIRPGQVCTADSQCCPEARFCLDNQTRVDDEEELGSLIGNELIGGGDPGGTGAVKTCQDCKPAGISCSFDNECCTNYCNPATRRCGLPAALPDYNWSASIPTNLISDVQTELVFYTMNPSQGAATNYSTTRALFSGSLRYFTVPPLQPGQFAQHRMNVTCHYDEDIRPVLDFAYLIDYQNNVSETNENNNQFPTVRINCIVAPPQAAIADYVPNMTVIARDPTIVGTNFTVSFIIQNIGGTNATNNTTAYLRATGTPFMASITPLAAGETSQMFVQQFTCEREGDVSIELQADSMFEEFEANETNNIATITLFCQNATQGIDYVTAIAVPETAPVGENATINITTTNVGGSNSPNSSVTVARIGAMPDWPIAVGPLASLGSHTASLDYLCSAPGIVQVFASADEANSTSETNETNNWAVASFNCTGNGTLPYVDYISTAVAPHIVQVGQNFVVEVTTLNSGQLAAATRSVTNVTYSEDAPGTERNYSVPPLGPLEYEQAGFVFNCPSPGPKLVLSYADAANEVPEGLPEGDRGPEGNNIGYAPVGCGQPSDLPDYTLAVDAPLSVPLGSTITVFVNTSNIAPVNGRFDSVTRAQWGEEIVDIDVPPLDGNGRHAGNATFQCTVIERRLLTVTADALPTIAESNEINNFFFANVTCGDAPDYQIEVPGAPFEFQQGQMFSPDVVITNRGAIDADSDSTTRVTMPDNPDQEYVVPALAAGGIHLQPVSFNCSVPGNNNLVVYADVYRNVTGELADDNVYTAVVNCVTAQGVNYYAAIDAPENATVGINFDSQLVITNGGDTDAAVASTGRYFASGGLSGEFAIPALAAGDSFPFPQQFLCSLGHLELQVMADVYDETGDVDPTDNSALRTVVCSQPDLAVDVDAPAYGEIGSAFTVRAFTTNVGGLLAGPSETSAAFSTDTQVDAIGALAPGESHESQFTFTCTDAGMYTLSIVADRGGAVDEGSEDNNVFTATVQCVPPGAAGFVCDAGHLDDAIWSAAIAGIAMAALVALAYMAGQALSSPRDRKSVV